MVLNQTCNHFIKHCYVDQFKEDEKGGKYTTHYMYHKYLLTPWSRVLLEKLTGSAASQEIPRLIGTRRFLTVPTSARHLSLSWANSIQSPQLPPASWRSILILSSHLRLDLANGLFPSGFTTRSLCTPLPSPIRATCPAHLILLDFSIKYIRTKSITIIKCRVQWPIFWSSRWCRLYRFSLKNMVIDNCPSSRFNSSYISKYGWKLKYLFFPWPILRRGKQINIK